MFTGYRQTLLRRAGRSLAALLVLAAGLLMARAAAAQQVDILLSGETRYYQALATTLAEGIRSRDPGHSVNLHYPDETGTWPTPRRDALLVTIGSRASADAVRRFPRQHQLSLFITGEVWQSITASGRSEGKAAIFIDQPPQRLLALARALVPAATTYATLFGPSSARYREPLEAWAAAQGVTLTSSPIDATSNPLTLLTPLMRDADLFIAIPEEGTLSRNLAKWVLHLSFQQKKPVIGFSKAYVNAGGTASLYSANDDISRQALEWLDVYLADPSRARWQTFPPRYFTVSLNPSVARILRLDTADEQELHRRVQQLLDNTQP